MRDFIFGSLLFLVVADAALAGTCANKFESSPKRNNDFVEALRCLENEPVLQSVPVGTIISSMLIPKAFEAEYGRNWILADGSTVASTSAYAKATGATNVPDLRGVFIRGLNLGREHGGDAETARTAGSYQRDALATHQHELTYKRGRTNRSNGGGAPHEVTDDEYDQSLTTSECVRCDAETRPRNVGVYFYIRVD